MSAPPRAVRVDRGPAPIDVLAARAAARAYLWFIGDMEIVEAVDPLERYAQESGLVRQIGQDAVQFLIASEFQRVSGGQL